jgi:threonine/homoserine/homoserine lactone efflux protein
MVVVVVVVVAAAAATATAAARILKKIGFCSIHYVGIEMMCLTDGHDTCTCLYQESIEIRVT